MPITNFLGSILGAGVGLAQLIGGARMHPQRPTYEIPLEEQQRLQREQLGLNAPLAGAGLYQQEIAGQQGATLGEIARTAHGGTNYLTGLLGALGQTGRQEQQLQLATQQQYGQREAALSGAEAQMAQYKDQAFDINQMQPYLRELQRKYNLTGAGLQNIMGAAGGLSYLGYMNGGSQTLPGQLSPYAQFTQPLYSQAIPLR